MFSKYKLNQVQIWGAYYDPIKQIDSIPIIEEEEITNVDMSLTWDSENRLKQVNNNSHDARYLYDSGGQRVLKRGSRTEIVYPTQFIQLDRAKKLYTKHIFVGTTRIASKLCSIISYFKDIEFEKRNNYTYHPDHLGSTSFVSDFRGEIYEYYQYTPYGEIWAEKSDILDKITHLFTSKELDAESGFYYFGARYLDPMTSRWVSPDPILGDYLPSGKKDENLPGMGGVFNPVNLSLYHYAGNNPIKYLDPTGEFMTLSDIIGFFLDNSGTGGKFTKLHINAINGNESAQFLVSEIWINAGFEVGIQTADIVSQTADGVAIVSIAVGFAPGAAASKIISTGADGVSLTLKVAKAIRNGNNESDWDDAVNQAIGMGAEFLVAGFIQGGMNKVKVSIGKNGYFYQLGRRGALKTWDGIYKKIMQELTPQVGGEAAEEISKVVHKQYLKMRENE